MRMMKYDQLLYMMRNQFLLIWGLSQPTPVFIGLDLCKIMYAYILYKKDNFKKVVYVDDIQDFKPRSVRDFDPRVTVRVFWRGTRGEIPFEEAGRYNAQVSALVGT